MRAVRVVLVLLGAAVAGYGLLLARPELPAMAGWLVAGPVLHDLLVAPLVGFVGLALSRLPVRRWRGWLALALAATGTSLPLAVPLLWRPVPAPVNPGLHDRDYRLALLIWLAAIWAGALLGGLVTAVRRTRGGALLGGLVTAVRRTRGGAPGSASR
ncbi:hypothetical protein ACFQ0D_29955 [Micromonospora zhanjiangensis]